MDYIFRIYSRDKYDDRKYDEAIYKLMYDFMEQQHSVDNNFSSLSVEEVKMTCDNSFFTSKYEVWLLLNKITDEVMGIACCKPMEELGAMYLGGFYVKPELRGSGIPRMMIMKLFTYYTINKGFNDITLHTFEKNVPAQKFFEKMGFEYERTEENIPGLKECFYKYSRIKKYSEAASSSSASFSDYIELRKDEHYYVKKEFDFHLPKRCVTDIKINPVILMFGKIYTQGGVAFDVVQANASKTAPYSYEEKPDRYILHYKVGDMFCTNNMTMTINNVEIIYKVLSFGQVLEDMEYLSVYDSLINCIQNNAELDVPIYFYEYTIAALMRDAKDTSKMVRQTNPLGSFKSLSISQINMRADTFVAVTTTDPETMIISALNERKDAAESPAKKTFLM